MAKICNSIEEVYEKTTKNLVENVVDGYNGTVFAYGATGSGKTHTMVGVDDDPGIMVRALEDLFKEVDLKNKMHNVSMSYLEIYNENIRDLLNPSTAQLELREDAKGNHQVAGLSEVEICSSEEVMSLLMRGNKRRTQESTGANKTSSRSHAVLMVQVKKRSPAHSHQQTLRTGRLYMVDLAGSERAAQTQNTGKRLLEGAHINKSLLALGNCINALAERNTRYVNFRDSKLTRILKEPLAGNCRTVMVGHISPSHYHFEESRNTLAYADRAKNITTKLRSNVSDVSYHVAQYQTIINELRQEIETLHHKISVSKNLQNSDDKRDDESKDEKKLTDVEMKQVKKQLISSFNAQMDVRRRMMEIDNHLLAQSIEFDKLGMIISEWETEKAVSALENDKEDDSNGADIDKNDLKNEMPEHVFHAWEELQFLKGQHERYLEMRQDCENDYQSCKNKTLSVTESLSEKASSREQRELLHLLTRVYELEIEKLEMQSAQLSREHELRCRDLMILRYDRQRQLCDEIITKQRILIDALATGEKSKNANARKELNELYRIYQQEINDLNNGRHSDLDGLSLYDSLYRPTSSGLRPLGSSGSMLELHQLESSKSPDSRTSRIQNPLPPIGAQGQNSRFSNSSSNSSTSVTDRSYRSSSITSPLEFVPYSNTSSNGGSSDSSDPTREKLKKVEEFEEPLRKRFGILPPTSGETDVLGLRRGRGTSSDSEVLIYNKIGGKEVGNQNGKKMYQQGRRQEIAEVRRNKNWSNSCPNEYYPATETTCLLLAQPTSMIPKEAFCDQKGGELFGRPLTEDLQAGLAKMLKEISEDWMPPKAYVGLERTSRMELGKDDDTWIFVDESEPFLQSNFSSWFSEPDSGDDCAVGRYFRFWFIYVPFPACESSSSVYTNFDGYCLVLVKDLKSYDHAADGCAEGHLMWMKNSSCIEQITQTFYNSKYFGGVYIGLKNEDGKWIYNNGEKEHNVHSAYDDHEFECGVVRLQGDMSLKIYSHPCFEERLWFLCEIIMDSGMLKGKNN
ncbi:Kinesin-like protein KIF19 like protein [Argiope bruennichi]|uniref:Kinesin-like protein KIF19 like protein n=1 Tax=Argiope bruennichi TaxID=94029 RepID=A0A8T0FTT6_ARGBR|nr:Kinesin-like protein KIF19 like protein [Argiope bruennichi]